MATRKFGNQIPNAYASPYPPPGKVAAYVVAGYGSVSTSGEPPVQTVTSYALPAIVGGKLRAFTVQVRVVPEPP